MSQESERPGEARRHSGEQADDQTNTRGSLIEKQDSDELTVVVQESESSLSEKADDLTRLSRLSRINLDVGFPGSYGAQLIRLTAEAAQQQEEAEIERSWSVLQKHENLRRKTIALMSKAAKAEPLLSLPGIARNALYEMQLVWIMLHCVTALVLFSKLTWDAKLRGPIDQVPYYSPVRMPTIPGQDNMHRRLLALVIMHMFIYVPACTLHFAYVLDDIPDETPLQLARKAQMAQDRRVSVRRSRFWSMDPRFNQFRRPRRRQWITVLVILLAMIICLYAIIVLINRQSDPSNALDVVHKMFECCGRSGARAYQDWWTMKIRKPTKDWFPTRKDFPATAIDLAGNSTRLLPFSCCKVSLRSMGCDHMHGTEPEQFYQRGCQEPIVDLLISRWMNAAAAYIGPMLCFLVPQMVLYLSIIQPREVVKQFKRTILEAQLLFTFWNEMNTQVKERTRIISQIQNKSLAEKRLEQEKLRREKALLRRLENLRKPKRSRNRGRTRTRGDSDEVGSDSDGSCETDSYEDEVSGSSEDSCSSSESTSGSGNSECGTGFDYESGPEYRHSARQRRTSTNNAHVRKYSSHVRPQRRA